MDQAERLAVVINIHNLKGKPFDAWCQQAQINTRRAYDLYKLHGFRDAILSQCEQEQQEAIDAGDEYRWPSWKRMFRQFCQPNREDEAQPFHYHRPHPANKSVVLFRKKGNDENPTPQYVFDFLNRIHHFDLDVCASKHNHKVSRYITKEQNALTQPWRCRSGFMNAPFSDGLLALFCKKAWAEVRSGHAQMIVGLVPAWTDTPFFQDFVSHGEIYLLAGRLKFGGTDGTAPFPSLVVVWTRQSQRQGEALNVRLLKITKP